MKILTAHTCSKHWNISSVNKIYWLKWRLWHHTICHRAIFILWYQTLSSKKIPRSFSLIFANFLNKLHTFLLCLAFSQLITLFNKHLLNNYHVSGNLCTVQKIGKRKKTASREFYVSMWERHWKKCYTHTHTQCWIMIRI